VEAGRIDLEVVDFNLRGVVEGVGDLFWSHRVQQGIEFAYLIERTCRQCCARSRRLRQVLTNLVGNAIKFTQQGEVSLHVALAGHGRRNGVCALLVRDNGSGYHADAQTRLFSRFPGDSSNHPALWRHGLGLVISKRLVEMMGARSA